MNPHIQLFFDMMQERYGVNGWKYDRNLNVQFTSSKSPNLQKLLLLGFGIVYTRCCGGRARRKQQSTGLLHLNRSNPSSHFRQKKTHPVGVCLFCTY